jgi:hypothetical protein
MKSVEKGAGAVALLAMIAGAVAPSRVEAQWVTTYDQFYLEAPHNWVFRERYVGADRLFNAFDFGHAILYETLWTKPRTASRELEEKWYDRLTEQILVRPPRVPLEESAIEIEYAKLVPEAKAMFEWAHILHRQLYDVLADERLTDAEKDSEGARLLAYYRTRRDLAFSAKPKSMKLMQEQPYSLAFRKGYPRFNGLIWAYHWLQVGLYEPLLVNPTPETRQHGVRATVARFWQMLDTVPDNMPHVMPMTPAVAPRFTARFPEAAIVFDNLHSMHDVVSDILANPSVPRDRKRAEILIAARRFRDDTSFVISQDAWRAMAEHMGIDNMGGPAVGFLSSLPQPTVTYGAVMTHDDRTGAMTGFTYGSAVGAAGGHAQHGGEVAARDSAKSADPHAAHAQPPSDSTMLNTGGAHDAEMMELYMRMMRDPVIRQRIMADTALHRMMMEVMRDMPPEHQEEMERMMRAPARPAKPTTKPSAAAAARPRTKQPARQPTKQATKQPTKTKAKAADPHAKHKTPQ